MKEDNLIRFTKETAAEMGRRGNKKSAETKRRKKKLKEYLQAWLEMESQSPERKGMTNAESISLSMIFEAENGNTKAYEVIRDTIGEKPVQEIAVSDIEVVIEETDS